MIVFPCIPVGPPSVSQGSCVVDSAMFISFTEEADIIGISFHRECVNDPEVMLSHQGFHGMIGKVEEMPGNVSCCPAGAIDHGIQGSMIGDGNQQDASGGKDAPQLFKGFRWPGDVFKRMPECDHIAGTGANFVQ